MDFCLPGSSVHGILQARILEWVAISFSRGIFPTQGSDPCLLHWQVDYLVLSHQGSQILIAPQIFAVALSCSFNQSDGCCISVRANTQRNVSPEEEHSSSLMQRHLPLCQTFFSPPLQSQSYLDVLLLIYFTSKPVNLCCVYFCFFFFFSTKVEQIGGFPGSTVVKNLPVSTGDTGDTSSVPGLGRSPGVRNGYPLQYPCLGNPMDRGVRWASDHGTTESQTRLSTSTTTTREN